MTRLTLMLSMLSVFFALPGLAANGTSWKTGPNDTGADCRSVSVNAHCYWSFDSAGESPHLTTNCHDTTIWVFGTTPDIDPYASYNGVFADATRISAYNQRTASFGVVTLNATDWFLSSTPFKGLMMSRQGGSGNVVVECKE